jgi:hypothetical protein
VQCVTRDVSNLRELGLEPGHTPLYDFGLHSRGRMGPQLVQYMRAGPAASRHAAYSALAPDDFRTLPHGAGLSTRASPHAWKEASTLRLPRRSGWTTSRSTPHRVLGSRFGPREAGLRATGIGDGLCRLTLGDRVQPQPATSGLKGRVLLLCPWGHEPKERAASDDQQKPSACACGLSLWDLERKAGGTPTCSRWAAGR